MTEMYHTKWFTFRDLTRAKMEHFSYQCSSLIHNVGSAETTPPKDSIFSATRSLPCKVQTSELWTIWYHQVPHGLQQQKQTQEETRNGSLNLAGKFCVAVVEVRREGREEAEEWHELAEEAVSMKCFFFFFFWGYIVSLSCECVNSDVTWSHWLA